MKTHIADLITKTWHLICCILRLMRRYWDRIIVTLLMLCLIAGAYWYSNRHISSREVELRKQLVYHAEKFYGYKEDNGTHRQIIDLYNAHEPRARGYEVTYTDSWCAVFGSTAALEADLTQIIPMECSCEQQIILFQEQNRWVESDWYLPHIGDYIYYDWNSTGRGDCTGWSDHVGIVVQTFGPVIKVVEGNKDDDVSYRYVFVNDMNIRGYGTPDYNSISSFAS